MKPTHLCSARTGGLERGEIRGAAAMDHRLPLAPANARAGRLDGIVGDGDENEVRAIGERLRVGVDRAPRYGMGELARSCLAAACDTGDAKTLSRETPGEGRADTAGAQEADGKGGCSAHKAKV